VAIILSCDGRKFDSLAIDFLLGKDFLAFSELAVTRLDRFARSTRDPLNLLDKLGKESIGCRWCVRR
jgi:DNA invertase Pin-like site-specific DNA recombinase